MEWVFVSKYLGAALAVGIAAFGSGFGEGYIAFKASEAIARQPGASNEIVRTMLITQAVSETAGIFGLLMSIIILFVVFFPSNTHYILFANISTILLEIYCFFQCNSFLSNHIPNNIRV